MQIGIVAKKIGLSVDAIRFRATACCQDRCDPVRTLAVTASGRELAPDIPEVGLVPAFGHLAINKSAASTDVEANLPPRSGYTHELFSRVGCADFQICFYDVVSLEAYSSDINTFIGNGGIHLSPENLKPFRSRRVSDRFQFMKPGIWGHDSIDPSRVWRDDRLREAKVVCEELRLRLSPSKMALAAGLSSIRCGVGTTDISLSPPSFQVLLRVHGFSSPGFRALQGC